RIVPHQAAHQLPADALATSVGRHGHHRDVAVRHAVAEGAGESDYPIAFPRDDGAVGMLQQGAEAAGILHAALPAQPGEELADDLTILALRGALLHGGLLRTVPA